MTDAPLRLTGTVGRPVQRISGTDRPASHALVTGSRRPVSELEDNHAHYLSRQAVGRRGLDHGREFRDRSRHSLELAKRGYTVAVTARRLPELEALAQEASGPGRIVAFPGDVTDGPGIAALISTVETQLGRSSWPSSTPARSSGTRAPISMPIS